MFKLGSDRVVWTSQGGTETCARECGRRSTPQLQPMLGRLLVDKGKVPNFTSGIVPLRHTVEQEAHSVTRIPGFVLPDATIW